MVGFVAFIAQAGAVLGIDCPVPLCYHAQAFGCSVRFLQQVMNPHVVPSGGARARAEARGSVKLVAVYVFETEAALEAVVARGAPCHAGQ